MSSGIVRKSKKCKVSYYRLDEIDGIFVFGDPLVSVITIGSLDFDVLRLFAALTERGWSLNALQFPFRGDVMTLPLNHLLL